MRHAIDPTVDCVFKAILGTEENIALLVHFLNAVLADPSSAPITEVTLLNPYNMREFQHFKESIVDVKARDATGRVYQIEIQVGLHPGMTERILHNWSEIYGSQIKKGEDYKKLKPVYSIWILGATLFHEKGPHLTFEAYDRRSEQLLSDNFQIHLLQLRRLPKDVTIDDEITRWMRFFKEGSELDPDNLPDWMDTAEMRKVMDTMESFSEEQNYEIYQRQLVRQRVDNTWRNSLIREREALVQVQAEKERVLAEKDQVLAEKDQVLAEKDQVLAEKDQVLAEKEQVLAEKEQVQAENARIRAEKEHFQKEYEKLRALLQQDS